MCDPAASSHDRPERVFTTPVVMPNISDGRDRVVYWVEHDTLTRPENHYLVRFYDNGGGRACELRDELDLGVTTASDQVPAEDREGVTGSPVVFGSPRSVLTLGYEGPLTTWSVGPSGWPVAGGFVDLSPWVGGDRNTRGGDTSVLVDPPTQTIIWGNKCTSERVANGEPCDEGEWGRVNITDLLAPSPPSLNRSKYVIMDADAWSGDTMADPSTWLELQTEHRAAGWAPGAAVRKLNAQGPVYDALTFVIAVGADVDTFPPAVSTDCPASEADGVPPRLYFVSRAGSWDPAWSVAHVDLVEDDTSTGRRCFEQNAVPVLDPDGHPVIDPLTGLEEFEVVYEPIDITAGVAVQGSMVYVATSDGRFWEYDTGDPNAVIHLAGYSGPWPRFRRNNHGLAQP